MLWSQNLQKQAPPKIQTGGLTPGAPVLYPPSAKGLSDHTVIKQKQNPAYFNNLIIVRMSYFKFSVRMSMWLQSNVSKT